MAGVGREPLFTNKTMLPALTVPAKWRTAVETIADERGVKMSAIMREALKRGLTLMLAERKAVLQAEALAARTREGVGPDRRMKKYISAGDVSDDGEYYDDRATD